MKKFLVCIVFFVLSILPLRAQSGETTQATVETIQVPPTAEATEVPPPPGVTEAPATQAAAIVPAEAGKELSFDLGLALEYLVGDSTYEIKGEDALGPFKSRLKWPLNTLFAGPEAKLLFNDRQFSLLLSYRTNVTNDPGDLKDYDYFWGEKSLLGEIGTEFTGHLVDFNFIWNCVRKEDSVSQKGLTLGLGGGYEFEYFDWDANDTLYQNVYDYYGEQLTGLPLGRWDLGKKEWITYKIYYHLPYLIVNGRYRFDKLFSISAFGKLIAVIANDEDDHVQRKKLSKANYTGVGLAVGGEGRFDFQPNFYAAVTGGLTLLTADGDQDQEWYDGSGFKIKGLDATTESTQASVGARVGLLL